MVSCRPVRGWDLIVPVGVRQAIRAPSRWNSAVHRALTEPSHFRFSMMTGRPLTGRKVRPMLADIGADSGRGAMVFQRRGTATLVYTRSRSCSQREPSGAISQAPLIVVPSSLNLPVKRCEKSDPSLQSLQTPSSRLIP